MVEVGYSAHIHTLTRSIFCSTLFCSNSCAQPFHNNRYISASHYDIEFFEGGLLVGTPGNSITHVSLGPTDLFIGGRDGINRSP